MVCIPLTPRHRAARRRWAAEHRDWEQHDWSQVLFTDESRFSLELIMPDRILLVWWRTCLKLKQYSVWNGQRALDLNPIGHVWDILGRRIAARPRPPATVRDLEIALLEE
ncbi:hypothetical protein TNCV_2304721 [Trichonephila clavipes]|nr:hypothetical protein TNCV_2304721 [Trichonephila clavipes]